MSAHLGDGSIENDEEDNNHDADWSSIGRDNDNTDDDDNDVDNDDRHADDGIRWHNDDVRDGKGNADNDDDDDHVRESRHNKATATAVSYSNLQHACLHVSNEQSWSTCASLA